MDRQTELRRLAQTLNVTEKQLAYLDKINATGLQNIRRGFQNALLDEFESLFQKLAGAGKLSPDSVSALLCKKVFGPAITANLSYYTPIDKIAGMCKHFDGEFMADVTREQIPERVAPMLKDMPVDLMAEVTRQLAKAGDFHIMGAMTDFLPEDKLVALMKEVPTAEANLRVSSFAQRKDRIAALVKNLPLDVMTDLIKAGFNNEDLIAELALVTAEMSGVDQERMAKLTDSIDKNYRTRAKEVAKNLGLFDKLKDYFAA